jgi:hypothetical protein
VREGNRGKNGEEGNGRRNYVRTENKGRKKIINKLTKKQH